MTTEVLPTESQTPAPDRGRWVGPIFFWDLIRESRKGSSYFPRVVYASGLLLVLYLVLGRGVITQNRISGLCEEAFNYYLLLQYVAILVLTPVYVSGAIIEDRQQRTLSLLLTTYLTPREIVLGKMMSRLVPMLGILLAGVPVLAILQLLGGIGFGGLIVHSLIALTLLFTVGMHAIRASTLCKTLGGAVFSSYVTTLSSVIVMFPVLLAFAGGGKILGIIIGIIVVAGGYLLFSWITLCRAIESISSRDRDQDLTQSESERQQQPFPDPRIAIPRQITFTEAPLGQKDQQILDIPKQTERLIKLPLQSDSPIIWKEIHFPTPDLLNLLAFPAFIPVMIFVFHWLSPKEQFGAISKFMGFYIECSRASLTLLLFLTTLRAAVPW